MSTLRIKPSMESSSTPSDTEMTGNAPAPAPAPAAIPTDEDTTTTEFHSCFAGEIIHVQSLKNFNATLLVTDNASRTYRVTFPLPTHIPDTGRGADPLPFLKRGLAILVAGAVDRELDGDVDVDVEREIEVPDWRRVKKCQDTAIEEGHRYDCKVMRDPDMLAYFRDECESLEDHRFQSMALHTEMRLEEYSDINIAMFNVEDWAEMDAFYGLSEWTGHH
ncbi:uncharacterized protein DSM5745_05756 [Aspergillus mulundensis]|uniref:Uncharacterized protein n=1 Tax=Aspergillus mulundensis TaxID=1810919 RepID=A0A3D8RYH1_9EURO|nr:hypothetical protein DSM5745_05756 [Aspergillus mulundensis]RDW78904.1 hypothetical protein DSM5745_05756 [Aspergillus mulundensis]